MTSYAGLDALDGPARELGRRHQLEAKQGPIRPTRQDDRRLTNEAITIGRFDTPIAGCFSITEKNGAPRFPVQATRPGT